MNQSRSTSKMHRYIVEMERYTAHRPLGQIVRVYVSAPTDRIAKHIAQIRCPNLFYLNTIPRPALIARREV